MKDIKFRGKRFDNGELVIGDLIENQGRSFIYHATSESTIEDNADARQRYRCGRSRSRYRRAIHRAEKQDRHIDNF